MIAAVDEPGDVRRRARMVRDQLATVEPRIRAAMAELPRHAFVAAHLRAAAYDDTPLAIGCGQTISQPRVVGRMLELLAPAAGERALDVGAGSGYAAALLARLGCEVLAVERQAGLIGAARDALHVHAPAVELVHADAVALVAQRGPFALIHVACAAAALPETLAAALADGGRLVAPEGDGAQHLVRLTRRGTTLIRERFDEVLFVPLVPGTA